MCGSLAMRLRATQSNCVDKKLMYEVFRHVAIPCHDQVSYVSLYASTHNPCLQPSVVFIFSPWCVCYMYVYLKVAQINTTLVAVY